MVMSSYLTSNAVTPKGDATPSYLWYYSKSKLWTFVLTDTYLLIFLIAEFETHCVAV